MNIVVLISCMHQENHEIIFRSNVQTDAVVINQCEKDCVEEFDFKNKKGETCHCRFVCTTERGLSRSRNMAIANAEDADVCLICDDDEFLLDDYPEKLINAFSEEPNAVVIAFALDRKDHPRKFPGKKFKLGFRSIGQVSSLQIAFRRDMINTAGIVFDVKMGSGTGNGGGEENMFLHTCRRRKLSMFYYPLVIAIINATGKSKWFKGYTTQYFQNLGWVSRRIHGAVVGWLYVTVWTLTHRDLYCSDSSMWNAYKNLLNGFGQKR